MGSRTVLAARAITVAAVVLTGISAGFFYTYADSVTRGLAIVDDRTYVLGFQAINATVRTGLFALVFFGPAPSLAAAALLAYRGGGKREAVILAAAAAAYAVGVIGVTFAGNVPLNDDLASKTDLQSVGYADARAAFEERWNQLNIVRAVVSFATFTMAAIALGFPGSSGAAGSSGRRRA